MVVLSVVWISFRPFSVPESVTGGDTVNQLGFGVLGVICAWLMATRVRPETRAALLHPAWFVMFLFLVVSILVADYPPGAFRAMIFSLIVVFAAATALALPRTIGDFSAQLGGSALVTLLFCFIAVFFFPEKGVHEGGGFEPQHAGLWRGVYSHKNIASYVAGAFAVIGFFVVHNGRLSTGLALIFLSPVFTIYAGSKTILTLLPVVFVLTFIVSRLQNRFFRALFCLLPLAVLLTVTAGSATFEGINDILQAVAPGTTFTGRHDLWVFTIQQIEEFPWTGYGFESFWSTQRITGLDQPIDLSWDVRGIVHAHNSYLDAAMAFGIPGMIWTIIVVIFLPVADYLRIPQRGNAGRLASLFIGLWFLTSLGACLESFFFRRADPVWFAMLIAIIGLRLTAHMTARSPVR